MADHNNPQSRTEEILIATIDGTEYDKLPQSRLEELLLELKEVIEAGGGGGGTTNYNNLSNLPKINNVIVKGEMTASDLSLVLAEVGKGLSTNDYSDEEKGKVADLITAIEGILTGTDIDSFGDVETALADKVDKVNGKGLSTNDFTDEYKAAIGSNTSAITAIKDGATLDSFGDVEVALLDKADTSDLGTAAAKDSTNSLTAGSTDLVESGAVKDAIDSAVSRSYHHAGTKTVAQLTHDLLIAANEGNVYNITDSGTTTSDFIEGIGRPIKEGANVGVAKVSDGVYMFDLLSGFVDTSLFVQKSQTSGLLKNDGTVDTTIEETVAGHTAALAGKVDKVDGKGLSTNDFTNTDKTAIENNTTAIDGIKDDLISVESAVGWSGKNILPLTFDNLKTMNTVGTWNNNVYTVNGVSFTVNMDSNGNVVGIQADGTATADASMEINMTLPTGSYIFSNTTNGSGASTTTYRVIVWESGYTNAVYVYDAEQKVNNYTPYKMRVVVINGYTASSIVFHPMIRVSSISDGTFQPYHSTVEESLKTKQDKYDTITYAQWQAMTPEQQAEKDYYISDYPSSVLTAGNISYDNTTSGMAANKVQGAIDELKGGLTGLLTAFPSGTAQVRNLVINGTGFNNAGVDIFNALPVDNVNKFVYGLHIADGTRAFFGVVYGQQNYASIIILHYNGAVNIQTFANGAWTQKAISAS